MKQFLRRVRDVAFACQNGRLRANARTQWALALLTFVLVLPQAYLGMRASPGSIYAPDTPGDSQDYDNIAWNLAHGRGFAECFDDEEFWVPYRRYNVDGQYDEYLERQGHSPLAPTSYRPPAYPAMLATTYVLFGRSYALIRMLQCLMFAGTCAWCVALAARIAGVGGGLGVLMFSLYDQAVHPYTGHLLTEILAFLGVAATYGLLVNFLEKPTARRAALAGVAMGVLILIRSNFLLWAPLICLGLMICLIRINGTTRIVRSGLHMVVFLGAMLCLVLPWWVRNCLVEGFFVPTGTQGGHALVAAYCDEVLTSSPGNWTGDAAERVQRNLRETLQRPPTRRESHEALTAEARRWLSAHWRDLPRLAAYKIRAHLRPHLLDQHTRIVLGLALPGLLLWRHPAVLLLATMLASDLLGIAVTYDSNGRFLVPVLALLYVLAGATVGVLLTAVRWPVCKSDGTEESGKSKTESGRR